MHGYPGIHEMNGVTLPTHMTESHILDVDELTNMRVRYPFDLHSIHINYQIFGT